MPIILLHSLWFAPYTIWQAILEEQLKVLSAVISEAAKR